MRSWLQFLTTPTADTAGTTLLLHFDGKRYLFGNVAEGTQRASMQQGAKLLKVSEIFITGRTEWSNVGGLIGLILTLADSASASAASNEADMRKKIAAKLERQGNGNGEQNKIEELVAKEAKEKPRLNIFGGGNLNYLLATARRFVFRKGMPLDVREFRPDSLPGPTSSNETQTIAPSFSDGNIKVWAMSIAPSQSTLQPAGGVHNGGAVSPRKRSYDELDQDTSMSDTASTASAAEKTAMVAKAVVSDMFDSDWRLDALVETSINDVKLPAALFVRDEAGKLTKYTGPMPGGPQPVSDVTVLVRRPWPGALTEALPRTEPAKESVSYIIRNHWRRGKFQPQQAKALGVKEGLKWAALAKGETVQNEQGETITPDMVLAEGREGGGVAIIDLPSSDYVQGLVQRPEWDCKEIMVGVSSVVWILGAGVEKNTALRSFMEKTKHLKHIISASDTSANRLAFDSAAASTIKLGLVDPARFSTPVHNNEVLEKPDRHTESGAGMLVAERGQMVELQPSTAITTDQVTPLLKLDEVRSTVSPDVLALATKAKEEISNDKANLDAWANSFPGKDVEIVTLGTGSASPSKYRNVSATLVRVPGWGSMLFDCGENTLGQLKRVFDADELKTIMDDLRFLWISHMHADHHLGTVSVIRAWYESVHGSTPGELPSATQTSFDPAYYFKNQKRLAVVSEMAMLQWLQEYSSVEDYGFSRIAPLHITAAFPHKYVQSEMHWFSPPRPAHSADISAKDLHDMQLSRPRVSPNLLNLKDLQTVHVTHCLGARAVSITFPSGFKASFSGDCRPSKAFSVIGKGSTVCIHEATFDDEMRGDAEAKRHSTTSEALQVASAMNAKACILTHFSQRYQKVPVLEYTEQDNATAPETALDTADEPEQADAIMDEGYGAPATTTESENQNGRISPQQKHTTIKLKSGTDMRVCVAFDYMRIKVGEIAQMEKFTPALIALFAEDEINEDDVELNDGAIKGKTQKGASKKQKEGKPKRNN